MRLSKRGALELRRKRTGSLVSAIQQSYQFDVVSATPLSAPSGLADYTIIGSRDRYGFPIRIALCHRSGVVFLVDRLMAEEYSRFYASGDYRRLLAAYRGRPYSEDVLPTSLETKADERAAHTVNSLRGVLSFRKNARLLDIGGSTGQLALAFQKAFGCVPTVVDPAEKELKVAEQHGLDTRLGQFETLRFDADETYDVVVLHQTIEHIMDLRTTMGRVRQLLSPGGIFIFDFLDFLDQLELYGCVEAASRLDHCHWLYHEMLATFLALTGFRELVAIRSRPSFYLVASEACPTISDARISDQLKMKLIRMFATREIRFRDMDLVEALSVTERLKRRLGMQVTPF